MRFAIHLLLIAWGTLSVSVSAQSWSPEQQEIWRLEEEMWQRDAAEDLTWIDTYWHADATSWLKDHSFPRSKASVTRWDKYSYANTTTLEHELFPLSITVTKNVAVVHYLYRIASENLGKERETITGRYSDVFVKEGSRWLLISVTGGDDSDSAK
jgi:ketosteroid isomerase-like protein